ncbi:hypothetical protein HF086_009450 [Spodoptera exigua]|uniref:Uncharacterized protein n=1 Tax=Spodoptera exigua TaxID=7107 RepID=A0A922MGF4_SPOEX|nr:hypothetical protein HF086_009450 [Spodoptera exigua]
MDIETSKTEDLKTEYVSHDPETSDTNQSRNEMPNSQSNTREKRKRKIPERYGYANACTMSIGEDELTFSEAISGPEKQQWLQAITEELQSFEDNQVWEVVDAPNNGSVVHMPADLLTKGLPEVKHYKFMKMLGIVHK